MNIVHEQCPKSDSETVLSPKTRVKCTVCTHSSASAPRRALASCRGRASRPYHRPGARVAAQGCRIAAPSAPPCALCLRARSPSAPAPNAPVPSALEPSAPAPSAPACPPCAACLRAQRLRRVAGAVAVLQYSLASCPT